MATFTGSGDLRGAKFTNVNLRGARFIEADLSGVVMRAVDVAGAEIDAPWLFRGRELLARQRRRRGPVRRGRARPPLSRARGPAGRRPGGPAGGLGRGRAHLGGHPRARRGDAGGYDRYLGRWRVVVDQRRCGTWSWPRTLGWARRSWGPSSRITRIGQPYTGAEDEGGLDMSVFTTVTPSYDEVLKVRAGRVAMVRGLPRRRHTRPADRDAPEPVADPTARQTVLWCLHVILNEEWEHHRFARPGPRRDRGEVRVEFDLDAASRCLLETCGSENSPAVDVISTRAIKKNDQVGLLAELGAPGERLPRVLAAGRGRASPASGASPRWA